MRRQQTRRARTAHRGRKSRKAHRNHNGAGSHKRRRSAPRSSRRVRRNDEKEGRGTQARSDDEPIRREQTRRINRRRSNADDTGTWSDDDSSWSEDVRPPKEFCGMLVISAVGCWICCRITGLVAIYYSWTAKESWDRRYYDESDLKYKNAKTWNFITWGCGCLWVVFVIIWFAVASAQMKSDYDKEVDSWPPRPSQNDNWNQGPPAPAPDTGFPPPPPGWPPGF